MVDMVEARKRAKLKRQESTEAQIPEVLPPQAKPVIRSEAPAAEPPSAYFPVSSPAPGATAVPGRGQAGTPAPPVVVLPDAIPTRSVPEDQVAFLQRLFLEETDDEDLEKQAEIITEEETETLIFQLGNENYGMDIQQIAEIIRFQEPTQVPNTIGFLDGIISLRGRMIPVINGRRRLGHAPKTADKKTRIIVLQDNTDYHGILVDSASQVIRIPQKAIEPTPSVVVGVDAEFIQGVCEYKSQLIILLNLERFLQFQ
jgi:purine-binding chemotaxis protein CheW